MIHDSLENDLTDFSLILRTQCVGCKVLIFQVSSCIKCITKFRDNRRYVKRGAVHDRCYGDNCC